MVEHKIHEMKNNILRIEISRSILVILMVQILFVSVGVWDHGLHDLTSFQLENSDIITYHNYSDEVDHQAAIDSLKKTKPANDMYRIHGSQEQQSV